MGFKSPALTKRTVVTTMFNHKHCILEPRRDQRLQVLSTVYLSIQSRTCNYPLAISVPGWRELRDPSQSTTHAHKQSGAG